MGSVAFSCRTCSCPREKDTAPGRRRLLNHSKWSTQLRLQPPSTTINIRREYIEKPDGTLLFGKLFEPKDASKAKAMMFKCIGFSDNTDVKIHEECVEYAEMGFVVFVVDWKGHGRSDGTLVHMDQFDADIVDEGIWAFAYAINKYIKPHNIYRKTIHKHNHYFLNGTSMGGAIAIKIALKSAKMTVDYHWKGIMLFGPMIAIKKERIPPLAAIWCMKHCLLRCCPKAKLIPNGINPQKLTRDAEVWKVFEDNPLFYDQPFSLTTGYNLMTATDTIAAHKHELQIPMFIGHGDDDQVTDCEYSKDFYESCGCKYADKTFKIYKNRGHMLYEEKAEITKDSVEWMEKIINKYAN